MHDYVRERRRIAQSIEVFRRTMMKTMSMGIHRHIKFWMPVTY